MNTIRRGDTDLTYHRWSPMQGGVRASSSISAPEIDDDTPTPMHGTRVRPVSQRDIKHTFLVDFKYSYRIIVFFHNIEALLFLAQCILVPLIPHRNFFGSIPIIALRDASASSLFILGGAFFFNEFPVLYIRPQGTLALQNFNLPRVQLGKNY